MNIHHLLGLLFVAVICAACTSTQPVETGRDQPDGGWKAAYGIAHPLVGQWYDVQQQRITTRLQVEDAVSQADVIFLGEKHDNPDHHSLQARFVQAGDSDDVLLMEMLVQAQKAAAAKLAPGQDNADMATVLDWDKNWKPGIGEYAGILRAALDRGMKVLPANASRQRVRNVVRQGLAGEATDFVTDWKLDAPLPGGGQEALEQQIRDVHCGYLPDQFVPAMATAQRLRDVVMAKSVLDAGGDKKFVIAGNGHVRNDRAIPALLQGRGTGKSVAVAFVEVQENIDDATNYASLWGTESLPFDYILFTPIVDPADPCEKYRHQFSKKPE